MPTYDYRCPNGHDFERFFRKISEAESELTCPVCGAVAVRRVSGGAGLLFKGSGFYLTDYGKNAHRKGGGDSAGGDSKSESSSESKSTSSESSKSDSSSSAKSETTSSTAPKSDAGKSTDTKSSSPKTKGNDSK